MEERLRIEYVETSTLVPYAGNAKQHPRDQIDQIKASIDQFGMNDPIAIWRGNEIIEGHGRLLACQELGITRVPVIRLDDLSDEERRAYMNVHNQLTMNTGFDLDVLAEELRKITTIDMALFGFDTGEEDEGDLRDDDFTKAPPEEAKSKDGELYRLGEHYLLVGDSTKPEDVEKLMGGAEADLCVTDPPYNVSLGSENGHALRPSEAKALRRRQDGLAIENDSWDDDEQFQAFLVKAFNNMAQALRPGAAFYIWYATSQGWNFESACRKAGLRIRQNLIWAKSHFVLGRQDYQWSHEPCLYGWKEGAGHYFINKRNEQTVMDGDEDPEKMKKEELVRLVQEIKAQLEPFDVMREAKPSMSEMHPTMKPVPLFGRQIRNSSQRGDTVLDLFGGSGTTIIACEQLGRKARVMEHDCHYADVIIERWETFTGQKAELVQEVADV